MFALRQILSFISICVGFALSAPLGAVTLFIDFNNADGEIRAFNPTPSFKQRDMMVLPSYERIRPEQRARARLANTALERWTLLAQECAVLKSVKRRQCSDVYLQLRQAELNRLAATGNYSFSDLKEELNALMLKHPGMRIDMLVVSGHHETGFYRGELSQATEREFAELIKLGADLFSNIDTVVLLGCSTGSRFSFQTYLAPLFPKATLIVGAEDHAPTRDEARNLAFIRRFTSYRKTLLLSKTPQAIKPIYQSLLAENWPVSLLWKNQTLFSKEGTTVF